MVEAKVVKLFPRTLRITSNLIFAKHPLPYFISFVVIFISFYISLLRYYRLKIAPTPSSLSFYSKTIMTNSAFCPSAQMTSLFLYSWISASWINFYFCSDVICFRSSLRLNDHFKILMKDISLNNFLNITSKTLDLLITKLLLKQQ